MKRVTDNFKLLRELLPETPDSDTFWSIRIIGRKKDNPSLEKNSKLYKSYTVACAADLDALAPKIAKCSMDNAARAYFDPTPKSWKKVSVQMMKSLADIIGSGDYDQCYKLADRVIGSGCSVGQRLWVVDVDEEGDVDNTIYCINQTVFEMVASTGYKQEYKMMLVPTPNGFHILSSPFDLAKFRENWSKMMPGKEQPEVKKNNPTVLYFNKFWD